MAADGADVGAGADRRLKGALAYSAVRRRRFAQHRAWMVRNCTVTFFFMVGPLGFGCLFVPLLVVETALRKG